MFRFYFTLIQPAISSISMGGGDHYYRLLESHLSDYMEAVFEKMCGQYLWHLLRTDQAPVAFLSLGRWWGNSPLEKKQVEIDLMGEESAPTALFAECKWRQDPVDIDVLNTLKRRSMLFHYEKCHYVLFARSGFTRRCQNQARDDKNVTLITFEQMCQNWRTQSES